MIGLAGHSSRGEGTIAMSIPSEVKVAGPFAAYGAEFAQELRACGYTDLSVTGQAAVDGAPESMVGRGGPGSGDVEAGQDLRRSVLPGGRRAAGDFGP